VGQGVRILLVVLISLSYRTAWAESAFSEGAVKVGFVFNFLKFTEFPKVPNDGRPFTICIAGSETTTENFSALAGKMTSHGPLALKLARESNLADCRILYVEASATEPLQLTQPGMLSIGESPDFIDRGGIIQLFRDGNQIRFRIRPKRAIELGLKLSSQLLSLAEIIEDERE